MKTTLAYLMNREMNYIDIIVNSTYIYSNKTIETDKWFDQCLIDTPCTSPLVMDAKKGRIKFR